MRPRGFGTWAWRLAIVALAGLGIAILIDALGGGKGSEPTTRPAPRVERITGPNVPQPAVLKGTLYIAAGDRCRLTAIDLRQVTQGDPGPETSCGLWAFAGGASAATLKTATMASANTWRGRMIDFLPAGNFAGGAPIPQAYPILNLLYASLVQMITCPSQPLRRWKSQALS